MKYKHIYRREILWEIMNNLINFNENLNKVQLNNNYNISFISE